MIVATAGHVDHGKTRLVQALTGVDTDRLPEEQRRGMTIEPGHAHADFGAGPLSLIDLPGHERFLRQMIAGACAVDLVLLVVAADEGPMPQTREHLAVLQLLGVTQLVVVLSKADRVDAVQRAQAGAAVAALLQGGPLAGSPQFAVSATQGDGIEALRAHLRQRQQAQLRAPVAGRFRLAVDRAFLRPGAGLVVTGAIAAGSVRPGQALLLSPGGAAVRVRSLQVQGTDVGEASAGQRCALNLVGVAHEAVSRGCWLLDPALHAPTQRLDVQLQGLAGPAPALPGHGGLHLHLGTAALPVRVVPVGLHEEPVLAQLLLPQPVHACHGDRFVLRDPAAQRLLGGGRVLDPAPPARGRSRPARQAELQALALTDPAERLAQLLAQRDAGVDLLPLQRAWNLDDDTTAAVLAHVPARRLSLAGGLRLLAPAAWRAVLQAVDDTVAAWHRDHPQQQGPSEAALLSALTVADRPVRHAALRQRVADGALQRSGFWLHRPGHAPAPDAADQALLARVHALMQPMGLRPQPLGDLAPLLGLDLAAAQAFLERVSAQGHLVQVARNRFFLPDTVQALLQVLHETAAAAPDGRFEAAAFRDRSGVGRNLSIQLLEFFDRVGVTRFAGDRRTLVDAPGRY